MRRFFPFVFILTLGLALACGDSDSPLEPGIDREVVVGTYEITKLTFDPKGSLPEIDIGERIESEVDAEIDPQLWLTRDGTYQVIAIDPVTHRVEVIEGEYTTLRNGVRLEFQTDEDAEILLLPRQIELDFDEEAGTLTFDSEVSVRLGRLRELVPEFKEEQLPSQVTGTLVAVFTR